MQWLQSNLEGIPTCRIATAVVTGQEEFGCVVMVVGYSPSYFSINRQKCTKPAVTDFPSSFRTLPPPSSACSFYPQFLFQIYYNSHFHVKYRLLVNNVSLLHVIMLVSAYHSYIPAHPRGSVIGGGAGAGGNFSPKGCK